MNAESKPQDTLASLFGFVSGFFGRNESSVAVAAALPFVMFSAFTDDSLTPYNGFNLSRNVATSTYAALGQSMVLVVAAMNLSLGAIGALSVVAMGYGTQSMGILPLLSAAIGVGHGML